MTAVGRGQQTSLTTFTLAGLGIGALTSLAVGLVWGLVIGDLARGVSQSVYIGLSATAVVLVFLILTRRRR